MLSDEYYGFSDSLISSLLSKALMSSLVTSSFVLINKCKIIACFFLLIMGLSTILFKSGDQKGLETWSNSFASSLIRSPINYTELH